MLKSIKPKQRWCHQCYFFSNFGKLPPKPQKTVYNHFHKLCNTSHDEWNQPSLVKWLKWFIKELKLAETLVWSVSNIQLSAVLFVLDYHWRPLTAYFSLMALRCWSSVVDLYVTSKARLVVGGGRDPVLNSSYYLWCQGNADPCLSDSTVTLASWLSDDNSDLRGGLSLRSTGPCYQTSVVSEACSHRKPWNKSANWNTLYHNLLNIMELAGVQLTCLLETGVG